MPVALLILPVISTLMGGWLALRARRYLAVLMALGAGLLLGTAFLDLLPEAIVLSKGTGQSPATPLAATLIAYLGFMFVESLGDGMGASQRQTSATRRTLGRIGGGMLILHSFRDGMVIGAAYSASHVAGITVACGIVAHDIGDGMNTVLLCTAGEKARLWDYAFLAVDALAPFAGGIVTIWWVQSPANAVILLAVAAGFFLQMATSDFLPDIRASISSRWYLVPITLCEAGLIYAANLLINSRIRIH